MADLTQKQIDNRKYHARHAQAIRDKKRDQYWQKKAEDPNYRKPACRPRAKPAPRPAVKPKQKPAPKREPDYRQRIEDLKILKDLELESY